MPTKRPDGSLECWGGPEDGSYITAFAGSTLRRFPGGAYFMTKESGLVYWRWAEDSRRSA